MEQPVVNCRKAFRSSDDIPHKTLTKRRKPGLRRPTERTGQQDRTHPKQQHQEDMSTMFHSQFQLGNVAWSRILLSEFLS